MIAFRPEASLIYVNADAVLEAVLSRLNADGSGVRLVVCDLSASPYVDLAGSRMLHELHAELAARGVALRIIGRAWGGCAICCAPMASTRRSAGSIIPSRSTVCLAAMAGGRRPEEPRGRCSYFFSAISTSTFFHVSSGLNAVVRGAILPVSSPRSFSYTTPS